MRKRIGTEVRGGWTLMIVGWTLLALMFLVPLLLIVLNETQN